MPFCHYRTVAKLYIIIKVTVNAVFTVRITNIRQAEETIGIVRGRCVQTTNPGPGINNGNTISNRKYLSRMGLYPIGTGRKESVNSRYYPYRSTLWPLVISA